MGFITGLDVVTKLVIGYITGAYDDDVSSCIVTAFFHTVSIFDGVRKSRGWRLSTFSSIIRDSSGSSTDTFLGMFLGVSMFKASSNLNFRAAEVLFFLAGICSNLSTLVFNSPSSLFRNSHVASVSKVDPKFLLLFFISWVIGIFPLKCLGF